MTSTKPSERLLKYPPMTRQDLNQSQLGSFKFTPVDSLRPIPDKPVPSKFLQDQLAESIARALAHDAARHRKAVSVGGKTSLPHKAAPAPDANFFNQNFKPDLSDSRLKLGSAALRSAVAGATSPTKTDRPSVDRLSSHNSTLAQNAQTSVYHNSRTIMDPLASTFTPLSSSLGNSGLPVSDGIMSSSYHPDPAALSQSLCLALANEQQAHNATKLALEEETQRCLHLEQQIEKYIQKIATLTTTVKSLGAIIKHNVNQENQAHLKDDNRESTMKRNQEEAIPKELSQDHSSPNVEEMEPPNPGCEEQNDFTEAIAVAETVVDEAQLFNLELLKSPRFDPSPDAALRNTLRKHFVVTDSSAEATTKTPANKHVDVRKLIDLSPESPEDHKEIVARDNHQTQGEPNGAKGWNTLLTADTPVLELPASIIAKYSGKPATEETNVSDQKDTSPNSWEVGAPKTTVVDSCSMKIGEELELREVASGQTADTTVRRITVKIPESFDGEPKWLVNKNNPLFDTDHEMWQVCAQAFPAWVENSPFPAFPVRYLPEQAAGSANAYRTVMVDAIPVGSTLKDVLTIVRSGILESILLVPPIGRVNPYMTSQVIFVHESAADGMYKRQKTAPFIINGSAVRVWKPMDPTYPSNRQLTEAIFGAEEATRIVLIGNIEEAEFAMVQPKLLRLNLDRYVIEYSVTVDGFGSIEFPSIKTAIKATAELKKDRDFATAVFSYDDDYTREGY
ncbi:hypothetical protein PV08_04595 [Exophiala spinifera]|uniref:Uncharacterized protein n=1 Tax=Exophiala spinifera TaxID=91928 RepID=A0A0D1YQ87_9EURO|nr:uncharacterized protein PV08_04595 [Exophiala spinifera]KIW17401.1 hypothetical protein PV08_04595 [Exophiala spinifera]